MLNTAGECRHWSVGHFACDCEVLSTPVLSLLVVYVTYCTIIYFLLSQIIFIGWIHVLSGWSGMPGSWVPGISYTLHTVVTEICNRFPLMFLSNGTTISHLTPYNLCRWQSTYTWKLVGMCAHWRRKQNWGGFCGLIQRVPWCNGWTSEACSASHLERKNLSGYTLAYCSTE